MSKKVYFIVDQTECENNVHGPFDSPDDILNCGYNCAEVYEARRIGAIDAVFIKDGK